MKSDSAMDIHHRPQDSNGSNAIMIGNKSPKPRGKTKQLPSRMRILLSCIFLFTSLNLVFLFRVEFTSSKEIGFSSPFVSQRESNAETKTHSSRKDLVKAVFKDRNASQRDKQQESSIRAASILSDYSPNRIPGFLPDSNSTYFGYVMREFSQRILSRKIASSNVLVVSRDAPNVLSMIDSRDDNWDEDELRRDIGYTVAGGFVLHARKQGHRVHALNLPHSDNRNREGTEAIRTLDQWWESFPVNATDKRNDASSTISTASHAPQMPRPNWILLAVFDPGAGHEDALLNSSSVEKFITEATVTYIVFKVQVTMTTSGGMEAIRTLLDHNYKVQILSMSHFPENNEYRSNTIIDKQNLHIFLPMARKQIMIKGGLFQAFMFATQGLDLAVPSRRDFIDMIELQRQNQDHVIPVEKVDGVPYINCAKFNHGRYRNISTVEFRPDLKGTKLPKGRGKRSFLKNAKVSCFGKDMTQILANYDKFEFWFSGDSVAESEALCIALNCDKIAQSPKYVKHRKREVARDVACITRILRKKTVDAFHTPLIPQASIALNDNRKLTGRVNEDVKKPATINKSVNLASSPPNLLVLMIDPISRARFDQSLPKTKQILSRLQFYEFKNYTAVGDNSGPNQAALYSGHPLLHRDGVATHTSKNSSDSIKWLWDELRDTSNYATLKAEDGCISNSNMVQSIQPNVSHGHELQKIFCFDFYRPNCVGYKMAAEHLTSYAKEFITQYSSSSEKQPWAAFLSFIDAHEDTGTLAGTLDNSLSDFISDFFSDNYGDANNAIVAVLSDHGLHYGSYFQTTQGLAERAQPLLHLKLPYSVMRKKVHGVKIRSNLMKNRGKWTTPFDVHATILHAMFGAKFSQMRSPTGKSLLSPLPNGRDTCQTTKEIPDRFCETFDYLVNAVVSDREGGRNVKIAPSSLHAEMPSPPSILSFFADLPPNRQRKNEPCYIGNVPSATDLYSGITFAQVSLKTNTPCSCSTSHRTWYECYHHPWSYEPKKKEHFCMIECPGHGVYLEVNVTKDDELVDRVKKISSSRSLAEDKAVPKRNPPNILFIEVDSVSIAYADRHFPKTRELLKQHRIHYKHENADNGEQKMECLDGLCAADFTHFGVTGPNSITNQVSALAGCISSPPNKMCAGCIPNKMTKSCWECVASPPDDICNGCVKDKLRLIKVRENFSTTWCTIPDDDTDDENSLLYNITTGKHNPWLLNIAKAEGYVTLFVEEFCFNGSPYVTQNNYFPLDADIEAHRVYCSLVQRKREKKNEPAPDDYLWGNEDIHDACIDGKKGQDKQKIPLDYIRQMWEAYNDVPKLAFLNAIAAHDYSISWASMTISARRYDDLMYNFLKEMMARKDADNTIIVIRSDHGLQDGPTIMEYSTQVEHGRPWTEIIVPQSLNGMHLEALEGNQDRLASGFDLYRTLREAMTTMPSDETITEMTNINSAIITKSIPSWSYNLFTSNIPKSRTCYDARIPLELCRNEIERRVIAPNYGGCNLFDEKMTRFCPNQSNSTKTINKN